MGRPELPDRPDLTFRLEAAAYHGRVVFSGSLDHGPLRTLGASRTSRFNDAVDWLANLILPSLMLLGAVLARHNVRLQRGDRVGAFRAAAIIFVLRMAGWLLGATHVADAGIEIESLFAAIASALLSAGVLWLTYLGLELYVRRTSPDSLIGWTRVISGRWNDPHVGRDALVGISAGLLMTILLPLYYILPPLFGRPEPIPALPDLSAFMGVRHVLEGLLLQVSGAIFNGMLGTVGWTSLVLLLKRRRLARAAAIVCFTPVAVSGMFDPGYPILALALGAAMIAILMHVIVETGLLAVIVALGVHFILMRAPLTTNLSTWWGPIAFWYVGAVAVLAVVACYVARSPASPQKTRQYALQNA